MQTDKELLENISVSTLSTSQLHELLHCFQSQLLTYRFDLHLPKNYTFSPELEFQKANRTSIRTAFQQFSQVTNKPWTVSSDLSVCHAKPEGPTQLFEQGMYGGEVTPQYLTDQINCWEQLQKACTLLTKLGAVASDHTSIHINIGAHIFRGDSQLIENLLTLWIAFEPEIFQFGMGNQPNLRPRGFEFSYPLTYLLLELYQKTGSFLHSYQMALDQKDHKSIALNLFSSSEKRARKFFLGNRIELRNFNGSLHPTTVQTDLLFSLSFVKYCVSNNFPRDLILSYVNDLKHPYRVSIYQDRTQRNIHKGLLLCDLLFPTTLDKLYFLKQWLPPSQEIQQPSKKKSLVF